MFYLKSDYYPELGSGSNQNNRNLREKAWILNQVQDDKSNVPCHVSNNYFCARPEESRRSFSEDGRLEGFERFPSTNFIIVANGSSIDDNLLRQEVKNSTVIALDGASSYLDKKSIPYHVLLGDFDSVAADKVLATFDAITDDSKPYEYKGYLVVPSKSQDKTDLAKGIEFCDQHGATKITIFGASGDREDHAEWNRNLLKKYYKFGRPLLMRGLRQTLRYVGTQDSPYIFAGSIGSKCGFFSYPDNVTVTTKGFVWDVEAWMVTFADQASVCNELAAEQASIKIVAGPGLLVIEPNPARS